MSVMMILFVVDADVDEFISNKKNLCNYSGGGSGGSQMN